MSASTFTKNLHLSQFQPHDTPDWLSDYNSDMEKIDTGFTALSQQTEPLEEQMAALTARVEQEEAQSQLQAQQIVSLQTGLNRNNETVADMKTRVNNLGADVDALTARVEATEDSATESAEAVQKVADDLAAYQAKTDPVIEAQGVDIAAAKNDIVTLQNAVDNIENQLEDFSNLAVTDWTAAAQVTGDLKMLTTWHNLRQLQLEEALELHDVEQLEKVSHGEWTSSAYALASSPGKVFNTHAPSGAQEAPNEAENYIGSAPLAGSSVMLNYYWHYDVEADVTYILFDLRDAGGPALATGQKTGGNLVFIAD